MRDGAELSEGGGPGQKRAGRRPQQRARHRQRTRLTALPPGACRARAAWARYALRRGRAARHRGCAATRRQRTPARLSADGQRPRRRCPKDERGGGRREGMAIGITQEESDGSSPGLALVASTGSRRTPPSCEGSWLRAVTGTTPRHLAARGNPAQPTIGRQCARPGTWVNRCHAHWAGQAYENHCRWGD